MERGMIFLISVFIFFSCRQEEKPVTREESQKISFAIKSSINNKKPEIFNKLFSPELLSDRIAKLRGKSLRSGMIKNVAAALINASLGQQIIAGIGKNGTYEIVKLYERDKKQHIIYRLFSDGKLNYHDYELERHEGEPYIADMFIYVSGENFSKTLSDLEETMTGNNLNGNSELNSMIQMRRLYSAGKYEEANNIYEKLPAIMRDQRSIQLMHVMISSGLSEAKYTEAINEFRKLYPDEPQMFLLMIDACIMDKDYAGALDCVNKIDAMIDKDPFLDYHRGLICRMKGDTTAATRHLEALYKNMPNFSYGVLELINQYIEIENFEKAREVIGYYKKQEDFNQSTLTLILLQHPDFKE